MVRRAAKKASSLKLTETATSSTTATTTTSSSSSTNKSTVDKSGSQISVSSGVHIADVTDLNKSDSQVSFGNVSTQYVVTAPENQPTPPKERIIFGGTQIVEVSSSSDQYAIDGKNNTRNVASDGNVQTFETMQSSSSHTQSSFSTSSEMKSTTDVDGKVSTTAREWGTSKNKATSDYLSSKSGTNIEPEIYQSQSHQAEKIKYDTGNNGDNPLYQSTSIDSQRKLQQIGNAAPVGHSSDHVRRVKYDDKSKKYITSEESKDSNVIDSITLQMVNAPEDHSSAINVIQDLSRNNRNTFGSSSVGDVLNSNNFGSSSVGNVSNTQNFGSSTVRSGSNTTNFGSSTVENVSDTTNFGSSSVGTVSNSTNVTKQSGTSVASTSSNIISSKQSKTTSSTVTSSDVTSGSTVTSNIKNSSDQVNTTNDQNLFDTTTTYTSKV